jgi:hypothetical protein
VGSKCTCCQSLIYDFPPPPHLHGAVLCVCVCVSNDGSVPAMQEQFQRGECLRKCTMVAWSALVLLKLIAGLIGYFDEGAMRHVIASRMLAG